MSSQTYSISDLARELDITTRATRSGCPGSTRAADHTDYISPDRKPRAGNCHTLTLERAALMTTIFDPIKLGDLELPNRIIMAPMGSNFAEADGRCGERIQASLDAI